MTPVPRPEGEQERLEALRELEILDTLPEQVYDDITRIAAQICDVPIALVSLVDQDRQWFKSRVGIEVAETPRDHAFCAHAILDPGQVMVVEDAQADPRFAANPSVTAGAGIRFYAGAPLVNATGHALGTLCVIDRKPRRLSPAQLENLRALSRQVVAQLELRRLVKDLERSRDELAALCDMLERQVEATDRDLHRAEQIQRSLLPREAPALGQCCLQSLYRPGASVGGDLFDAARVDEQHVVLVIADAAGHGLSAALLSVLFRERLRFVDDDGRPYGPGEALAHANAEMRASPAPPGMFVTAVVALLDTERRELRLASAGHPPVLLLGESGSIETVAQTGPALGLFDKAEYAEHRLQLANRDRVLFYTDGLLDLDPAGPTPLAAIGMALSRIGRRRDALQVLYEELSAAGQREDRDDVTLLLLDLAPGESCFLEPAAAAAVSQAAEAAAPRVRFGESTGATFFALGGRVTWLQADAIFEAALAVIEGGRSLIFDLEDCEQLDSTLLGTMHELVARADAARVRLVLQRVPQRLVTAFEELNLASVIAHIGDVAEPLPAALEHLPVAAGDIRRHRQRLLRAHQALATLSERNREIFAGVIGNVQSD